MSSKTLKVLRIRLAWLVFVLVFLFLTKPFGAQSQVPVPVSVCQAMHRDGPSMCLTAIDAVPLDRRIPILLIHGWNRDWSGPSSPEVWNNFIDYAAAMPWVGEKFKLYHVTYYSNLVSISDIGRILASLIDDMDELDRDFAQQKIFLIGHSMGGLVARSFMQEWRLQAGRGVAGGERVLRLVTLATPHHGTPLANGPSRDESAGTLIGWIINLADDLIFRNAPWHDYNRFDLHDDGFLNFATNFDYQRFQNDFNLWLNRLNSSNPYNSKMSVYAGSLYPSGNLEDCKNLGLRCSALLIDRLYSLNSDGIVPTISALARPCEGCMAVEWWFNGYDHYQMVKGRAPYDSYLFGAIMSDLSDFVALGDNRFGSSVTMGNPASEAFHNIRGWSAEIGQDPIGTVFRSQPNEQQTYVDLFVPRINVPYRLSFKRGGDTCGDDRFYVYITINDTDVPTQLLYDGVLQCRVVQGNSFYQFRIPDYAVKKNKIRVGFYNWSEANPKLAPMYYVRLDPA